MSQVSGQAGPSETEDGEMREDDGGRLDGEDERSGYVSPAHNTAGGGPSVPQDNAGGLQFPSDATAPGTPHPQGIGRGRGGAKGRRGSGWTRPAGARPRAGSARGTGPAARSRSRERSASVPVDDESMEQVLETAGALVGASGFASARLVPMAAVSG